MAQEHLIRILTEKIQRVLTPDLLKPEWAAKAMEADANPLTGHCYAASQALYHALGGKEAGWTPKVLNHAVWPEGLPGQGDTHWFLQHRDGTVADPTAGQFGGLDIPYERGKGAGFLTRDPDRRASAILSRTGYGEAGEKGWKRDVREGNALPARSSGVSRL